MSVFFINTNMESPDEPSDAEKKNIEKLLKSISKKEPTIRRKSKSKTMDEQQRLSSAIANRLSEYCDCYMLFGFDTNGNPLILVNSANNMEYRALSHLLTSFVDETMVGDDDFDTESDQDSDENML